MEQLTEFTIGWTCAEVEQCVVSALTKARLEEREVTGKDLLGVAVKLVPLSRTMKEQINHIRGWAFERAVRASTRQAGPERRKAWLHAIIRTFSRRAKAQTV